VSGTNGLDGLPGVPGPTGPTGPTGTTGPSAGLLRALTSTGSDLGIVYTYERSFPVANAASPDTNSYVPIFAVKEQNGTGPAHMLLRLLYTGTPVPCPLFYAAFDCSGTPIGMDGRAATGFACGIPGGHAGRADPTAGPVSLAAGSSSFGRYDGADFVFTCTAIPGVIVPMFPIQDLGASAPVAARVYLEAAP